MIPRRAFSCFYTHWQTALASITALDLADALDCKTAETNFLRSIELKAWQVHGEQLRVHALGRRSSSAINCRIVLWSSGIQRDILSLSD
jgi:hypothetical protein